MSAVVQIITALERGGAQRLVLEVASRLHQRDRPHFLIAGADSKELFPEAKRRLGDRLLIEPRLTGPLGPRADLAALLALSRKLNRLHQQYGRLIVSTHSSKAGVLGRLAARSIKGTRTVHTVHGFGVDAMGPRLRPIFVASEQLASAATDVLVLLTQADLSRCDELGLSQKPERRVLPGFIDNERFKHIRRNASSKAAARARFGIAPHVPLALTIGNLKPQKDPLFHIDVLRAWRQHRRDAELLFLGDGPLRHPAEQHAIDHEVQAALHLPGFVGDVSDALVAADVVLLASRWEGLPLSILEALASGLPVVVRHSGWAHDLSFAGAQLQKFPLDVPSYILAEALDRAIINPPPPMSLPAEYTLDGALVALKALYQQLAA